VYSVWTSQWIKGWQNDENKIIEFGCNQAYRDVPLFLGGAWLHSNLRTWHLWEVPSAIIFDMEPTLNPSILILWEVGQQKNQYIGATRSNNDARCLAPNAMKHYSSISFFVPCLQLFCVDVMRGRLYRLFVAETTSNNYSFVWWCLYHQLLWQKSCQVCLVLWMCNEVVPFLR